MTLYLMRCVAAGTTLFSVYDESGALCCTAQTLSGLFGDGFQITGTLNDREAEIYISPMLLPHIRMFTVQVGGQRRAQLRMMLDGSVRTLRVDGAPCTVLGRPMTGGIYRSPIRRANPVHAAAPKQICRPHRVHADDPGRAKRSHRSRHRRMFVDESARRAAGMGAGFGVIDTFYDFSLKNSRRFRQSSL